MEMYEVVLKDEDGDGSEDLTVKRGITPVITLYDYRHYVLKAISNAIALFCSLGLYHVVF